MRARTFSPSASAVARFPHSHWAWRKPAGGHALRPLGHQEPLRVLSNVSFTNLTATAPTFANPSSDRDSGTSRSV